MFSCDTKTAIDLRKRLKQSGTPAFDKGAAVIM